jgi:hypothetical protein
MFNSISFLTAIALISLLSIFEILINFEDYSVFDKIFVMLFSMICFWRIRQRIITHNDNEI